MSGSWLLVLALVTGCASGRPDGGPGPGPGPSEGADSTQPNPSSSERIAFSSNRYGNYELFTAKTDGSDMQKLVVGGQLAWSWDAQQLAFVVGGTSIYTIDAAGTNAQYRFSGSDPAWSPDGERLVFTNDVGIIISSATSYHPAVLLPHTYCQVAGEGMCATPRYSPDGTMITFVAANASSPLVVHVMTAAGLFPHPLAAISTWNDSPTWTSDSSRIVYTTLGSDGTVHVASRNRDGSGEITLATGFDISVPAISPDGQSLAFQYSPSADLRARIWAQPVGGSKSQLIPDDPAAVGSYEDVEVAWSPR